MKKKHGLKELPIYNGSRPLSKTMFFTGTTLELGYTDATTGEEWMIRNYADGKKERCRLRVITGTLAQMFKPKEIA